MQQFFNGVRGWGDDMNNTTRAGWLSFITSEKSALDRPQSAARVSWAAAEKQHQCDN